MCGGKTLKKGWCFLIFKSYFDFQITNLSCPMFACLAVRKADNLRLPEIQLFCYLTYVFFAMMSHFQ